MTIRLKSIICLEGVMFVTQVDFQVICKHRWYAADWTHRCQRSSEKGRPFHAALFLGLLLWPVCFSDLPLVRGKPSSAFGTHTSITSPSDRAYTIFCRFTFPAQPLNCLSPPLRECKLLESSHLIVSSTAHDRVLVQHQLGGIKNLSGLLGEVVLNVM